MRAGDCRGQGGHRSPPSHPARPGRHPARGAARRDLLAELNRGRPPLAEARARRDDPVRPDRCASSGSSSATGSGSSILEDHAAPGGLRCRRGSASARATSAGQDGHRAPVRAPHVQRDRGPRRTASSTACSRRPAPRPTRRRGSTGRTTTRTCPKDALELAIKLEAERMAQLVLRDRRSSSEKEVVANERRQRVDDDVDGPSTSCSTRRRSRARLRLADDRLDGGHPGLHDRGLRSRSTGRTTRPTTRPLVVVGDVD